MEQREGNANVFGQALTQAISRLAEIEKRYATLAIEREQLQAVVSSLKAVVPKGLSNIAETNKLSTIVPATSITKKAEAPAWKLVEEEFLASGNQPMSVAELAERMRARGLEVERKTISVAIIRKPGIFVPTGEYGKHRLRVLPANFKISMEVNKNEAPA
jgi:hypothetical protein